MLRRCGTQPRSADAAVVAGMRSGERPGSSDDAMSSGSGPPLDVPMQCTRLIDARSVSSALTLFSLSLLPLSFLA